MFILINLNRAWMKLLRHVQICWAGVIILKVEGKNFADDGRHACNVHSPLNFQSAFFSILFIIKTNHCCCHVFWWSRRVENSIFTAQKRKYVWFLEIYWHSQNFNVHSWRPSFRFFSQKQEWVFLQIYIVLKVQVTIYRSLPCFCSKTERERNASQKHL